MQERDTRSAPPRGGATDTEGSDLQRVTSGELCSLLSQPRTPRVVIRLLRNCGLSHAHIAEAVGASTTSVANWSAGKSEPSDALYERLDFLRAIASHILANRLDEHGKRCTTLAALKAGRDDVVVDAVRAFGNPARVARSARASGCADGGVSAMGDAW
jgi:DNA-binding transcriptional regulator YiaG